MRCRKSVEASHHDDLVLKCVKAADGPRAQRAARWNPADARFTPFIILGLVVILVLGVLNSYYRGLELKASLVAEAAGGFEDLNSAAAALRERRFDSAFQSFRDAHETFSRAHSAISMFENSGASFAQAAAHTAQAGAILSDSLTRLAELPELFRTYHAGQPTFALTVSPDRPNITGKLHDEIEHFKHALAEVEAAQAALASSDPRMLPAAYRPRFDQAQTQLKELHTFLSGWIRYEGAIQKLLGSDSPHRYVILFQNKNELRPTGGFIGSYLLATIADGFLIDFTPRDVYDGDGALSGRHIEPPYALKSLTEEWRLRDANYSPDFPTSAEKILWFLEQEGIAGVDTVIATDQTVLGAMFDATGPIAVPELSRPLDSKNFDLILQYFVESKLSGLTTPKQILFDFMPLLRDRLLRNAAWDTLIADMKRLISSKHIQAYSTDPEIQRFFEDTGVAHAIKWAGKKEDYLHVSNLSVGANKSDAYVRQSYVHETFLNSSGEIADALTITKEHLFKTADADYIKSVLRYFGFDDRIDVHHDGGLLDILGRGTNKSVVRVFVPAGSTLFRTEGMSVSDVSVAFDAETNKDVFSFIMEVPAWSRKEVTLRYRLPFKLDFAPADTYRLTVQKQAGTDSISFVKKLNLSPVLNVEKTFPSDWTRDSDILLQESVLAGDGSFGAVISR